MRKFLHVCAILALGMIGWSCTNDDTEPILPPEITVGTVDMISAEGGEGSISYEITNPISETTLPEAKSSQEWVHSFQATAEAITFMVDANDSEPGSEPRTATLTISYPDAEPVMATITQAAPDPVKELTFTIEIVSEATDGIVASITPTLEDATYVSGLIYVDDYTTDEELIANDIQSFQEEDWMGNKGQISDYLETGTQTEKKFGAYKSGDVYIYAYGLTAEGEATSAVFKESATVLERPSITTTPDYTASYAPLEVPVEGGQYEVSFTVENPIEGAEVSYELEFGIEWVHDIVLADGKISFTVDSNEAAEPDSEPRKTFILLDYPNVASRPAINIRQVAPEKGTEQELSFTIEIVSQATDGIVANITPSLEDATYVSGMIYVSDFTTDEELIANDIQSFQEEDWMGNKGQISDYLETGTQTEKRFGAYKSGDVYIYAYGLTAAGEATSAVFKKSTTVPERPSITTTPDYTASYAPLEVPVEGGQYEVSFTVENPVEGAEVTFELQYGVEWVHDIVLADGKISFTVDSNEAAEPDSEPRTAFIGLDYPNAIRAIINIRQVAPEEGEGGQTTDLTFEIEVVSLSTNGSYFNIIPSDKEATYIVDYVYASSYTSDEDIIADELKYLYEYDLETGDLMKEFFYTYMPGDLYIYALGVNADKTVTSKLFKELVTVPLPSIITMTPDYSASYMPLEVPVEGGTYEINYTIENPVEGAEMTYELEYGVDWVRDIIISEDKITFTVDSNEAAEPGSEPRTSYFNLIYPGATSRPAVNIRQASPEQEEVGGQTGELTDLQIDIQVGAATTNGFTATFIPSDLEATYIVDKIEAKSYVSDEDLVATAVQYVLNGYTDLCSGELRDRFFSVWNTNDVYVYALGIKADGTVTTNIFKKLVDIPAAPKITTNPEYPYYNPMQIPVEGGTFDVTYTIENPVEGAEMTYELQYGVDWIRDIIISEDKVTFTVDSNAAATPGSEPRVAYLNLEYPGARDRATIVISQATPTEAASTLEFEFQVESVASDGAYVTIIPSNDTDTYVVGQISLSNYTTDQAVIDSEVSSVLQFGAEELNQGTLSSEYFWNWQPGEIYVYAVGITVDGTVTTPLYKQSITIPAAPVISTTPNYPFYNPMQIPVEGGTFEISYTVENPVEGGEVTCVPPFGVEWIHDFVVYEDKVTFVVDSNENAEPGSEVRTAFFNLDYTGANNRATVNISQAVPSL